MIDDWEVQKNHAERKTKQFEITNKTNDERSRDALH